MPDHSDRAARFDALFTGDPDPWNFETSGYEAAKRRATIASLGDRTFARALEVGCATGALTAELAERCETLIGIDVSQAALDIAKRRLAERPGVNLSRLEVPAAWPEGTFDLIVFSEVLYFLDPAEIDRASRLARGGIASDGVCLLVDWTGESDLALGGDEAAERFIRAAGWTNQWARTEPQYRIDLLAAT